MRRALLFVAVFGLLAAAAVAQETSQERPLCRRDGDRLVLSSLPDVLARSEVARKLEAGLTTSFVVRVTARDRQGNRQKGRGLAAIRYDGWDRIYSLTWQGEAGSRRALPIPNTQTLRDQWRLLELPVLEAGSLSRTEPWRVRVELAVEPFSSDEEADARRWLDRPPNTTEQGAAAELSGATRSTGGLSRLFDILIPPIGRKTILELEWSIECRPSPAVPARTP